MVPDIVEALDTLRGRGVDCCSGGVWGCGGSEHRAERGVDGIEWGWKCGVFDRDEKGFAVEAVETERSACFVLDWTVMLVLMENLSSYT